MRHSITPVPPLGASWILLSLALAAPAHGQVQGAPGSGRVVADTVHAPSLAGNLFGDPVDQPAWVYLPPGYDAGTRRYPVLYLLHGVLDEPGTWLHGAYQGLELPALMDSLIESGAVQPMIVVLPNGGNALGGSFYRNSPVTGGWGDYVSVDLVRRVDGAYRTIARPESRALAGHSMGGYGALHIGILHPDVFSVVYAMNPCCLCCLTDELSAEDPVWRRMENVRAVDDLWSALEQDHDPWPLIAAAVDAAFSPDPGAPPLYGDPPFALEDGRLVATGAADRWRAGQTVAHARERAPDARRLRGLAWDSAFDDEYGHIPKGAQALSDSLTALHVPYTYQVYAGDHRDHIRQRLTTIVLPWISERLVGGPAGP